LAALDHRFTFEVFNLGESWCIKLSELVSLIAEISGRKAELQRLPAQPGDAEVTCADIDKARQLLSYNPQTSIRTGLAKFIEWFEEQPNGR